MRYFAALLFLTVTSSAWAENLTVQGTLHAVTVSNLQRMEHTYSAIAASASDGMHLQLHVFETVEPSRATLSSDRLYLDTVTGRLPLLRPGSNEITLPKNLESGASNPNVMAALRPGETIHFNATVTFDHEPLSQFNGHDARAWMTALDRRISRKVGVILNMLVPDTNTLLITIPPHAEFTVTTNGVKRTLVLNQGDNAYVYELQPRDYPISSEFSSNIPIADLAMRFPVPFNTWHGH